MARRGEVRAVLLDSDDTLSRWYAYVAPRHGRRRSRAAPTVTGCWSPGHPSRRARTSRRSSPPRSGSSYTARSVAAITGAGHIGSALLPVSPTLASIAWTAPRSDFVSRLSRVPRMGSRQQQQGARRPHAVSSMRAPAKAGSTAPVRSGGAYVPMATALMTTDCARGLTWRTISVARYAPGVPWTATAHVQDAAGSYAM